MASPALYVLEPAAKLHRTFDAARLNEVANHPDVRPFVGGEGELDLSSIVADPRNFALEVDGGGFIMQALERGIYEVHSLFLPEARGQTVTAMQDGMRFMFCHTDCFRLLTLVPTGNIAAAALARKGGFSKWFERSTGDYLALDLDAWIAGASWADAYGAEFHEKLEAAKHASGSSLPIHDDDPVHDRFVGMALAMARAGNAHKGIAAYNRWAAFAGYAPATLLSTTPVLVDVGDGLVTLDGERLEVVSCR